MRVSWSWTGRYITGHEFHRTEGGQGQYAGNQHDRFRHWDTEKFNAFLLLAGVVDFNNQIPSGVLRAHITDYMPSYSSQGLPQNVFERWASTEEFDKWKEMINRPIHLSTETSSAKSSSVPVDNNSNSNAFPQHRGQSKKGEKFTAADTSTTTTATTTTAATTTTTSTTTTPVLEYVFVSLATLSNLLENLFLYRYRSAS